MVADSSRQADVSDALSAFEACLLPEGLPGGGGGQPADGFQPGAQGPHRARNVGLLAPGFPRQFDRPAIDERHLVFQPIGGQLDAVRSEGVGFQQFGAGPDVLPVDFANQAGIAEADLVEAAVDEDTPAIEHGAHGPVGDKHPLFDSLEIRCFHPRPPQSPSGYGRVDAGDHPVNPEGDCFPAARPQDPGRWTPLGASPKS